MADKCGAKTRAGGTCQQVPIHGTRRCRYHGGKSPNALAGAARRQAEDQMRKVLGRLNVVPVEHPLTELLSLAGEAKAWKNLCAEHVANLERLRYGTEGGEQIRGEIVLFERAMDRCNTILSSIAKLNIDERLAAIQERQVEVVAVALGKVLAELGLSLEQQQEARHGLARHLRVVPGGAA